MPSLREALRILEAEGLIRMKLGRGGGAIVMRPSPLQAGYLLGMVMQSRKVVLGDVLQALEDIEPICAAGCARRSDRAHSVLPRLRSALDAALESLDDPGEYASAARHFHTELIAGCGTETTVLLVGALEALWTAHVIHLVERVDDLGPFAHRSVRLETVHEHERIFELIAAGDVAGTEAAMREHYSKRSPDGRSRRHDIDLTMPVEANLLWSLQGSALPG